MLVKMGSSSPNFGVKIKIFELPPPSYTLGFSTPSRILVFRILRITIFFLFGDPNHNLHFPRLHPRRLMHQRYTVMSAEFSESVAARARFSTIFRRIILEKRWTVQSCQSYSRWARNPVANGVITPISRARTQYT